MFNCLYGYLKLASVIRLCFCSCLLTTMLLCICPTWADCLNKSALSTPKEKVTRPKLQLHSKGRVCHYKINKPTTYTLQGGGPSLWGSFDYLVGRQTRAERSIFGRPVSNRERAVQKKVTQGWGPDVRAGICPVGRGRSPDSLRELRRELRELRRELPEAAEGSFLSFGAGLDTSQQ